MASHYDRSANLYATHHSPIAGPSRGEFYDRQPHPVYPPRPETEYVEEEHFLARRDDRLYYPRPEYVAATRESRGEEWIGSRPRRHTAYLPRPPSPPGPVANQYSRHYQELRQPRPTSPRWDERVRRDTVLDDRAFEPSTSWRQGRHQTSYPRLNSLLNPVSPSLGAEDPRWRDSVPVERPMVRDYGRHYPPDYQPHDDRPTVYYDRTSFSEANSFVPSDNYHQPVSDRVVPHHWEHTNYPPEIVPASRAQRPSALRDYKRPRQTHISQSPRLSDTEAAHWTRESQFELNRISRDGSSASPALGPVRERERIAGGSFQLGPRSAAMGSAPSTPPTTGLRNTWDISSDEFSADESVKGTTRSVQTLKQTLTDISRSRDVLRRSDNLKSNQDASINHNRMVSNRSMLMPTNKHPQPVMRQAWDPATNQLVTIMDSDPRKSSQVESSVRGDRMRARAFTHLSTDDEGAMKHTSHSRHMSSDGRLKDISPRRRVRTDFLTADASLGTASSRQGVMSVHDLVTPSAAKPYTAATLPRKTSTPILIGDENSEVEEIPGIIHAKISEEVKHVAGHARLVAQRENLSTSPAFLASSQTPAASPRRFERQRSPSDEPSAVEIAQVVTPDIWTPDPDADGVLAVVEAQIAETTISSPKPSVLLQPGEKLSQDGTMRILAPRPKADEKEITETLRKAIVLRRALSTQSRDQRVNPILMDNLSKADGQEQQLRSSSGNLVEEIMDRILTQTEEEQQMNTRAFLATNFAEQRELLAEKTQRLRDEYLMLHETWIAHCSHLDSLFKANDMQEALTQAGRTTRRSATTLGDAVRSDLEMEQIIASLGNEDLTDPNHLAVRNVATIPDMISVVRGRIDYLFDDTNNMVDDPEGFYDPRSGFYDWAPEEEEIFYAKYAENPKQFGMIAEALPHKTSQQCVLYYYIHKKKLVDFRNAANSGNGKRRKGIRKAGKQKGNALLADVAQADSRRPAGRGRRRGRGGFADAGRGRGVGPPPSTQESVDGDGRSKRRRVLGSFEDAALSADTDNTREPSVVPPKKRRGRKPKLAIATESPGQSPAPGDTKFIEGNETTRRKPAATSTHWSESDREIFMRLLARHGKDFKRISAELPNKTSVQVGNYYKNHNRELGLEKIALAAANRVPSPEHSYFVTVSRAEASQSRTPTEEIAADQLVDRQVADATSRVGVLTLEQNGKAGQSVLRTATNSCAVASNQVINVLNPDAFQSAGASKPRGIMISSSGTSAYTLGVSRQPAEPQSSSTMTSSIMNMHEAPSRSRSPKTNAGHDTPEKIQDRSRSGPPTIRYALNPHLSTTFAPNHMRPASFVPANANNSVPLGKIAHSSHDSSDFRSGIPVQLLPSTYRVPSQREFLSPNPSQSASPAPGDTPARRE